MDVTFRDGVWSAKPGEDGSLKDTEIKGSGKGGGIQKECLGSQGRNEFQTRE